MVLNQFGLFRSFLLVFAIAATGAVAAANPVVIRAAGAALLLGHAPCTAAPGCVVGEIAARTVKLEMDRVDCSGVLTDARTIRTAGHCFANGGALVGVTTADGTPLRAEYTWRHVLGRESDALALDQAEIRADRDLIDVGRLPRVRIPRAADRARVWVAGYPGGGPLTVHAAFVSNWLINARAGLVHYEIRAPGHWRLADGISGGPVFVARGCELRLLGTAVGSTAGADDVVQGVMPRMNIR